MIFESPDGGKTVFGRLPHVVDRVDILSPETQKINNLWFQWRDILTASQKNPALMEALERARIIYELSRDDTN